MLRPTWRQVFLRGRLTFPDLQDFALAISIRSWIGLAVSWRSMRLRLVAWPAPAGPPVRLSATNFRQKISLAEAYRKRTAKRRSEKVDVMFDIWH